MLPHEWLLTARGPIKTDHEQHGDDHFFPGPCDPAWDVAATLVEFACATPAARGFVNAYEARSHDRGARAVLGTWLVLYLAARVGYVTFAGTALAGSPEAARFQRERARYAARLARELARTT